MKKSVKITLILAAILILLGTILCVSVAASIGRNWSRLSTFLSDGEYSREEYVIAADQVSSLLVEEKANDIQIIGGDSQAIQISYVESGQQQYDIELDPQGQLRIRNKGNRNRFDLRLFLGNEDSTELQISIPENLIGDLTIRAASSNVNISGLHIAGHAQIETASGNLRLYNCSIQKSVAFSSASGDLWLQEIESGGELRARTSSGNLYLADSKGGSGNWQLSSTSGNVSLQNNDCGGQIELKTTSGEAEIENLHSKGDLQIETTSGDQELDDLHIEGDLQTESASGDIELQGVSAQNMDLRSTSGDIEGTLIGDSADYSFNSRSTSGSVRLPSGNGNRYSLHVSTTSGDVELQMHDR